MMEPVAHSNTPVTARRRSLGRKIRRWLGLALVLAGVGVLAWAFVVWRWNDPFTAFYTHREQAELRRELNALVETSPPAIASTPAAAKPSRAEVRADVERAARRLRASASEGSAIGRLVVPRLGLDMVVVDGTSSSSLKRGPGLDRRTFMPGEGELSYIAGHRTTYGAPFANVDRLRPNDPITVVMPYGTLHYRVTRHQIVDDEDLSVLRSKHTDLLALQACHPRFFATQRYIVWATLRSISAS
jgi:sortase A